MSELMHYGTPRHSGRYPWGSGEDPYQSERDGSISAMAKELKDKGLTETEIAKALGMTTEKLRQEKSLEKAAQKEALRVEVVRLKDKGYSQTAIAERIGKNESYVRYLLEDNTKARNDITYNVANMLKDQVKEKKYLDVGTGTELYVGVSRTKFKTAVEALKNEGYVVNYLQVEQLGTGKKTSLMVLSEPGTTFSDAYKNRDNIKSISNYSEDGGRSFLGLEPIRSINSSKVFIRYGDQGGSDKDGVIELRRNVPELSLGEKAYAQVRIGVDDTHYLKGMALYSDDIPKGYDVVFNTNKPSSKTKEQVMKAMKDDPDNPFGATVRQRHYIDKDGNSQLSAINIVNEEGDWSSWSKAISSQVLSKQRPDLAKKQLDLAYAERFDEYDSISKLENVVVKEKLLLAFADECDSASSHLKAAALPRQASHVLLPFPDMNENEVYAPNYRDGEKVVLIRYPHGGTFEIPELVVNNKAESPKKTIGLARDAIGIHPKVAQQLSGADFDGDTVLVIPNPKGAIKTSKPLKDLENFDPKLAYPSYPGMKVMSEKKKQNEMGRVSNLITDMTIQGASPDEIARAVKHSMVVIDAVKHELNYEQSYRDNGIADLKAKYQGSPKAGAATLISKAGAERRIPARKESRQFKYGIDPETGKKVYEETGETYVNKKGKVVKKLQKTTGMEKEEDAYALSSGTVMESVYADYANKLKSLANQARKEAVNLTYPETDPTARKLYSNEVSSLNSKLNIALKNAPLERQAQIVANAVVKSKVRQNPEMENDQLKKIKGQALVEARLRVGAKKTMVQITEKEWAAIQAKAISPSKLKSILDNTDMDVVKKYATPRATNELSSAQKARIKSMARSGYSQAEIADALGISTSTVNNVIK